MVLQDKSTNWRTKGKTGKNRKSGLLDKQQWQTEKTGEVVTCKQDRERAERTDVIQKAYNHAVAILRGDV